MTHDTEKNTGTIIDLDADQVVEDVEKTRTDAHVAPVRKSGIRFGWLYGAIALLAAAAAGGWLYKDVLGTYLPSDQLMEMSGKVAMLEAGQSTLREQLRTVDKLSAQLKSDIDAMEAKDAELYGLADAVQKSQGSATGKMAALEQSLAETRQAVDSLAARPAVTADGSPVPVDTLALSRLQQRIEGLEKDVASLKAEPAAAADNQAALSQGLSDLKARIGAGTSYRDEYDRIQRMVPAAAGLDVLQQYATPGLPDAKGLAGELRNVIGDLPKPIMPGPVPESQSWWSGIYNSMSDLITIRIEGDVDWPTAASAAAALADSGDLPQAIEQLSRLEGDKPAGVQQWIDRANARMALEAALKSVEAAVLRVIAAKG